MWGKSAENVEISNLGAGSQKDLRCLQKLRYWNNMKLIDTTHHIYGNGGTWRGLTGPIGFINIEYLANAKSGNRMYISTNTSE
jgi:hypothetical protein